MKKTNFVTVMSLLVTCLLLAGCVTMPPFSSQPPFIPEKIDMHAYQAKVDNFVVILDASASMDTYHQGSTRFAEAKAIVSRLNASLPDLELNAGLRTFGHAPSVSNANTVGIYGISAYKNTDLQSALDTLNMAGGNSPLGSAIDAVNRDLQPLPGKTALIIVSDGQDLGNGPYAAATRLKKAQGDDLCIYTVAVGSRPGQSSRLDKLAEAGGCGYAARAVDIADGPAMAGFVRNVFLMEQQDDDRDGVRNNQDRCPGTPPDVTVDSVGCPRDVDRDGVADYLDNCAGTPQGVEVDESGCPPDTDMDSVADFLDACPGTPQGVDVEAYGCPVDLDGDGVADFRDDCPGTPLAATVDPNGCPLDTDNDGVADYRDNCPNTPGGETIDAGGCPLPKATQSAMVTEAGTWLYEDIQFDTGSAAIKPGSYPVLAEIAATLKQNPNLRVEIQGHTDSAGSLAYNNRLSAERAEAVQQFLIDRGVAPDQLTSAGYGPAIPLVSNDTPEGRARNRRVELKPLP